MSFLPDLSLETLGKFRIHLNEKHIPYFEKKLQVFNIYDKKDAGELRRNISDFPFSAKTLKLLLQACIDFPEDLFNLGFIILSFRENISKFSDRFIHRFNPAIKVHKKLWKDLNEFFLIDFSPAHFSKGLFGSRNIVFELKLSKELGASVCIRKRLSPLDKKRIGTESQKTLPQFGFEQQFAIHEELFMMSETARKSEKCIAKLPYPIFADSNYQVMEFVDNPTLSDFAQSKYLNPISPERISIDKNLSRTFSFWKEIFFKHNDFHSRNCLISPSDFDLTVIDFDISKFCSDISEFESVMTQDIGGSEYRALDDDRIEY